MPKPNGTLTLKRVGSFDINVTGKNHCGTRNPLNIQYQVEVTCSPVLDQRGFLFDQINVQHFFEGVTSTSDSCENLSIDLSRKLWKRIQQENPDCNILEMSMTLAASPYKASMTFNFKNEAPSGTNRSPEELKAMRELDLLQQRVERLEEDNKELEEDNQEMAQENEDLNQQIKEQDRRIINANALLSHWLRGGLRGPSLEALKEDTRKWLPKEPKARKS